MIWSPDDRLLYALVSAVQRSNSQLIGCLGAAAGAIGSVMTWISLMTVFGSIDVKGTQGDGQITLGLGIAAVVLGLLHRYRLAAVAAVLGIAVSAYDLVNITSKAADLSNDVAHASAGEGLYICLGGFLVAAIFFFKARSEQQIDAAMPISWAPPGTPAAPRSAAEIREAYRDIPPATGASAPQRDPNEG
jgi:hypothetical protein